MKITTPLHPRFADTTRLLLCFAALAAAHAARAQDPTAHDVGAADALLQVGGGGFGGVGGATQVTISPDGATLGWIGGRIEGGGFAGIWLMPAAGGKESRITGVGQERDMSWSPDGSTIAFLSGHSSDRRPEPTQIYLASSTGAEGHKLTDFSGQIGRPEWSPDGKSIAFLGIENPTRVSGATQPFKPQTGVVGSKPDVQRLAIVDVATGKLRWATPPATYIYEFGWSPDSQEIAVTAAKPPGENNWWTAKLYAANISTGNMRLVATPEFQINYPRWSPDGKTIAYIGGVMSDFGSIGGDVYAVAAAGGKPRNLTPGHRGSANAIKWTHDGRIIIGETVEGETAISSLNPATGIQHEEMRAAASFSGDEGRNTIALSTDGKVGAYISASLTHAAELFTWSAGRSTQLSHWSGDPVVRWGAIKSIHWTSGKFRVQGWLVAPQHMEAGKKYPMIVQVHGGPAASVSGSIGLGQQASFWSQSGYYVFMPNPRGSYGEGEEFTMANRKDFGYGDFRDIMAGVDQVIKQEPVDGNRLGLTGGSYGGYMTMWGVTQTNRFKAAVAVAGIANWKSYYGENSIDQWMIPYFGATVYDDPRVYAKSSPIEFIKQVKTPTMIAVGEFDGECPPPQSYEYWHALNVLGVKTELLVYPGEGHGIRQPDNRRDLMTRELAWFNYYLK